MCSAGNKNCTIRIKVPLFITQVLNFVFVTELFIFGKVRAISGWLIKYAEMLRIFIFQNRFNHFCFELFRKFGVEVDNLARGTVGRSLNLIHTERIADSMIYRAIKFLISSGNIPLSQFRF